MYLNLLQSIFTTNPLYKLLSSISLYIACALYHCWWQWHCPEQKRRQEPKLELWLDSNQIGWLWIKWECGRRVAGAGRDNRKLRQTTKQQPRPRRQRKWHKPHCGGATDSQAANEPELEVGARTFMGTPGVYVIYWLNSNLLANNGGRMPRWRQTHSKHRIMQLDPDTPTKPADRTNGGCQDIGISGHQRP